jgi:4a-hydroxytetrahydrobiopterin dehydratase
MKITEEHLAALNTSDWQIEEGSLTKTFKFKNFKEVVKFANAVFEIAENQNHHPEMKLSYSQVIMQISNHDEQNISKKCYDFSKAVDFVDIL